MTRKKKTVFDRQSSRSKGKTGPSQPSIFSKLTIWPQKRSESKELFGRHTLADAGFRQKQQVSITGPRLLLCWMGAVGILAVRTFRLFFTADADPGDSWRMAYRFTNKAVPFVVISMSFVGMIMVYQSTEQLARAVGDTQLVGASFLKLLVRVLGPTVIGMLLACRVGAGIAAEIGAMAVTDQLDAMRMCSADPVEVLMVPRVRGGMVASVVLVIIGSVTSAVAGLLTGMVMFATSPNVYWNFELIEFSDITQGLVKAVMYGITIPIVCGACGLAARGGARGVGEATTNAVVGSSLSIVVLDSLVSLSSHVVTGQ